MHSELGPHQAEIRLSNGERIQLVKKWGEWHPRGKFARYGSSSSLARLERRIDGRVKASKSVASRSGAGEIRSGGSLWDDLFGTGGGGNSAHTVKPKGATRVKPPKVGGKKGAKEVDSQWSWLWRDERAEKAKAKRAAAKARKP